MTYVRVRKTKPRIVWEISPSHGFSTLIILAALKANDNNAKLYSFDIQNVSLRYLSGAEYEALTTAWVLVEGDAKQILIDPGEGLKYPRPE